MLQMVQNPGNTFFAGDTKQTINPSGFRWEEVKRHFYERGLEVPEVKYLTLNFRNSGSIIEISNMLLGLKEKFLGIKAEESREEWRYKGRPVAVVTGIVEDDMLEILRVAGAKRTILVRTGKEKTRLKKLLETELVFTLGAAMECFKNGGDEKLLSTASALYYEKMGKYLDAATHFEKIGEFKKALPLWNTLKNEDRVLNCRIEIFKKEGKFHKAGTLYLEIQMYEEAAELYYKGGTYPKAEEFWKKTKNENRLLELYEKTGQNDKLLAVYEKQKNFEKTVKCLKTGKDTSRLVKERL